MFKASRLTIRLHRNETLKSMVSRDGFEPPSFPPEGKVLPLDERETSFGWQGGTRTHNLPVNSRTHLPIELLASIVMHFNVAIGAYQNAL